MCLLKNGYYPIDIIFFCKLRTNDFLEKIIL